MISRQNKPQVSYQCFSCLRRLGFGYDRTAKKFLTSRESVYRWFKYHEIEIQRPETRFKKSPLGAVLQIDWHTRLLRSKQRLKLKKYLRKKLWSFFKHGLYPKSGAALVGCNRGQFVSHILSMTNSEMSLKNYGYFWELDHIKPLKKFDLTDSEQCLAAFHFSNIQPLTKDRNRRKSARYEAGRL